jgi:hypothetical protein
MNQRNFYLNAPGDFCVSADILKVVDEDQPKYQTYNCPSLTGVFCQFGLL